jgi:hypothetical protein
MKAETGNIRLFCLKGSNGKISKRKIPFSEIAKPYKKTPL